MRLGQVLIFAAIAVSQRWDEGFGGLTWRSLIGVNLGSGKIKRDISYSSLCSVLLFSSQITIRERTLPSLCMGSEVMTISILVLWLKASILSDGFHWMTIAESWLPPPFPSPTLGPSAPRWRDSPISQFYSTTLQLKIDSQEMNARSTLHCQNLWPIAISQLGGFLHFLESLRNWLLIQL